MASGERMNHRIWADSDGWHSGQWVGRYQTARGIRTLPEPYPTIEAAKIAAGEAMCAELDEMAEHAITLPITPGREAKRFNVSRNGRRSRPVLYG